MELVAQTGLLAHIYRQWDVFLCKWSPTDEGALYECSL